MKHSKIAFSLCRASRIVCSLAGCHLNFTFHLCVVQFVHFLTSQLCDRRRRWAWRGRRHLPCRRSDHRCHWFLCIFRELVNAVSMTIYSKLAPPVYYVKVFRFFLFFFLYFGRSVCHIIAITICWANATKWAMRNLNALFILLCST